MHRMVPLCALALVLAIAGTAQAGGTRAVPTEQVVLKITGLG